MDPKRFKTSDEMSFWSQDKVSVNALFMGGHLDVLQGAGFSGPHKRSMGARENRAARALSPVSQGGIAESAGRPRRANPEWIY